MYLKMWACPICCSFERPNQTDDSQMTVFLSVTLTLLTKRRSLYLTFRWPVIERRCSLRWPVLVRPYIKWDWLYLGCESYSLKAVKCTRRVMGLNITEGLCISFILTFALRKPAVCGSLNHSCRPVGQGCDESSLRSLEWTRVGRASISSTAA